MDGETRSQLDFEDIFVDMAAGDELHVLPWLVRERYEATVVLGGLTVSSVESSAPQ